MREQILEFLASDVSRNLLASVAALLTIIASAYAFLRWLKRRYGAPNDPQVAGVASKGRGTRRQRMREFRAELEKLRSQGSVNPDSIRSLLREFEFDNDEHTRALQVLHWGELYGLRASFKETRKSH